jgi:hypothetical protein
MASAGRPTVPEPLDHQLLTDTKITPAQRTKCDDRMRVRQCATVNNCRTLWVPCS